MEKGEFKVLSEKCSQVQRPYCAQAVDKARMTVYMKGHRIPCETSVAIIYVTSWYPDSPCTSALVYSVVKLREVATTSVGTLATTLLNTALS